MNTKKNKNIENIKYMYNLSQIWDRNVALPFTEKAKNNFLTIIENIDIQPDIAPTKRNSMYFEFTTMENAILAYEIKENSIIEVYIPAKNNSRLYNEAITKEYHSDFAQNINNSLKKYKIISF